MQSGLGGGKGRSPAISCLSEKSLIEILLSEEEVSKELRAGRETDSA